MTPEAVEHLRRADRTLGRLIRAVGPCTLRPKPRRTPFQALAQAVVFQQLNGAVAEKILGRVKALYPGRRFPTPEDLLRSTDESLRGAGLSRAKVAALKDVAAKTIAGVVPGSKVVARMPDEEIVERLTAVRGIGPWTVEMFLIFTLGRADVLPATDYGVRKGFALRYGREVLPGPKEILEFGERWRPHRTTAAWYLWRSLELPSPKS